MVDGGRTGLIESFPVNLPFKEGDRPADFRLCSMGGTCKALHDYWGRKTVVFLWASWCESREFLGPLQDFHRKHPGANVVTIAFDAQGVDHPLRYLTRARATFEMLIDASCVLSRRWGIKETDILLLLDENGVVMMAAKRPKEADLEKIDRLLDRPPSPPPPERKVESKDVRVELLVQGCTNFLSRKRVGDAVESLRKALALDPGNMIVARQVLVLKHPEKFYDGPIDGAWLSRQPPVSPL